MLPVLCLVRAGDGLYRMIAKPFTAHVRRDPSPEAEVFRLGFLYALVRVEGMMAGARETGVSVADVLEDLRKEVAR